MGDVAPIIPAPVRLTPAAGEYRLGPAASVAYRDPVLAPLARRFGQDVDRRCGIPLRAVPSDPDDGTQAIVIGLGDDPDFGRLPVPLGVDPAGTRGDERYLLAVGPAGITLRGREPVGVARGLASLLQLIATTPQAGGAVPVPALRILDAPRFAWRGLSVDVARRFFPPPQIQKLIDLAALYKLDVLQLHLTDDQGWRIEAGRPGPAREPDGTFYTNDELRALAGYAADRFVTLVPEVDTPGHARALMNLRPELRGGGNHVRAGPASGPPRQRGWLDPELPLTFSVLEAAFAELAGLLPGPYVHIGGDEPWGMPDEAYGVFIRRLKQVVRALGKHTVGWQETIRAESDGGHVVQYWMDATSLGIGGDVPFPPEVAARVTANYRRSRDDVERALARRVPVIVSPQAHCYLDVPYADASADPGQQERRERAGNRFYGRKTLAASFDWDPVTVLGAGARPEDIAGVSAAVWCETVRDVDDLTFLLLPRLAGTAEKAWGAAGAVRWEEHRIALARHGRLWRQDGLTFFPAQTVAWA
jgi:hexosaminidase